MPFPLQNSLHLGNRNGNPRFRKDVFDVLQAVALIDSLTDVICEELRDLRARSTDLAGRFASKSLLGGLLKHNFETVREVGGQQALPKMEIALESVRLAIERLSRE